MKQLLLTLAFGMFAAKSANAAISLAFDDGSGNPAAATVAAGTSFNVTLILSSTEELTTTMSYLLTVNGAGSGGFRITGLDVTNSAFSDLLNDTAISLSSSDALLAPTNTYDLGGLATSGSNGAGSFVVANLTFEVLSGFAPGVYTIMTDSAFATDENFDTLALNQPIYTVTVVPEASTAVLFGLVGLAGLARRKR